MALPNEQREPPPVLAEETFRFPLISRLFFVGGTGFFLVCFLITLVKMLWPVPGDEEITLLLPLLFLGFTALCGGVLWMSLQHVTIDAEGVTRFKPGLGSQRLAWKEVRLMRENPSWSMLELHGLPGEPVVKVSYMLQDFARLREIILARCPGAAIGAAMETGDLPPLPVTFHKGRGGFILVYVIGLSMLVGSLIYLWPYGVLWVLFGAGMGAFCCVAFAFEWHSLTVEPDRLVLKSLLRSRTIPLQDIDEVDVDIVEIKQAGITSGAHLMLYVVLAGGQQLKLGVFKDQTTLACEVIRAACQKRAGN